MMVPTMNSYTRSFQAIARSLSVLSLILLLVGCNKSVFSGDVECPPLDGKQHVRITASVLTPVDAATRALQEPRAGLRTYVPGTVDPFEPTSEKAATAFESQIATLRVIGFYADGAKKDQLAFNKIFVNEPLVATEQGWTISTNSEIGRLSVINSPLGGKGVAVEFETDLTGSFNIVLVANESLKAVGTPPEGNTDGVFVTRKAGTGEDDGASVDYNLNDVQKLSDLKETFLFSVFYILHREESGTTPNPDTDLGSHIAHYRGALPWTLWRDSNGGIPMVGQGHIDVTRTSPSATGGDRVSKCDINLERVLAKLEVNIWNTDDSGNRSPNLTTLDRLVSIQLNNNPMYAMLLPSERGADKDYATPGTQHIYYSDPSNNPYMELYRADQKTLTKVQDGKNWDILPINPRGYTPTYDEPLNPYTVYAPSYLITHFHTYNPDDRYAKVQWMYYTRPGAKILKSGEVEYLSWSYGAYNNPTFYYKEIVIDPSAPYYGYRQKPLVLYMLPTTNDAFPEEIEIASENGQAGMKQAPTEVIVRTARRSSYDGMFPDTPDWFLTYYQNGQYYNYATDNNVQDFHFRLSNNGGGKTNDKYAIRRNTIYRLNLKWEGKEMYLVDDEGIKVLPWKVENETIEVDIDDAVTPAFPKLD